MPSHHLTMRCSDPVLFFYAFAASLASMWTPDYVQLRFYDKYNVSSSNESSTCGGNDTRSEAEKYAQSKASDWLLYLDLTFNIPAVIITLLIGGCSDKYGRRPLMILPLIGAAIEAINFLVVMGWNLPLEYLFIGSAITGLTGGSTTLFMAVFSYTADVSTHKNRTWRLGVLESMLFSGGCLGQLLGGVFVQHVSPYAVEGGALACFIAGILYVTLAMTKSVKTTPENRDINCDINDQSSDHGHCFQVKILTAAIQIFNKRHMNRPQWYLVVMLIVFGVTSLVIFGSTDIEYLYLLGRPLCWKPDTIGYYFTLVFAAAWLSACFLLPLSSKLLHLRDTTITLLGLASMVASYFLRSFAYKTWIMFLVPVSGIFGGFVHPTLRAMMSKLVGKRNQGALFSVVASLETVCTLSATSIFNPLFAATNESDIPFLPSSGAVSFLVIGAVLFIPVTLTVVLYCVKADTDNEVYSQIENEHSHEHEPEE